MKVNVLRNALVATIALSTSVISLAQTKVLPPQILPMNPVGNAVVVEGVELTPMNGGINPNYYAYVLSATVEAGTNPCYAANSKIGFAEFILPNHNRPDLVEMNIIAKKSIINPNAYCPASFQPVYRKISTVIRGHTNPDFMGNRFTLENVGEFNHSINPLDLVPKTPVATLKGYIKVAQELNGPTHYLVQDGTNFRLRLDVATAGLQNRLTSGKYVTLVGFSPIAFRPGQKFFRVTKIVSQQ